MKIRKKTWITYFQEILDDAKPFDARLADFEYKKDDILIFEEYDQKIKFTLVAKLKRK